MHGDLIKTFQYLKMGVYREAEEELFARNCSDRTRSTGYKLRDRKFMLDIRRKLFTVKVARHCKRLPGEAEDAPTLAMFKARLEKPLSNLV